MQQLQLDLQCSPLITVREVEDILQGKIIHKMNVPDLPVELWIEILSYLPRGFVWKMIGLNRFLFELGMDELYEEVRLGDCDTHGLKILQQIQHTSIASRVYRLHIRPTFLPGIDNKGKPVYNEQRNTTEYKSQKIRVTRFLQATLAALSSCSRLKELTIVLHDQHITSAFLNFLHKLMERVGPQLTALSIDATPSSFLSLSNHFPKIRPNLSSLVINLTVSRFEISKWRATRACKAVLALIGSVKASLESLVIETIDFNLSTVFDKLNHLPLLKSVELRAKINRDSLLNPETFITFLQYNAATLQRLVITPQTADVSGLLNPPTLCRKFSEGLLKLQFPRLQELCLDLDRPFILTNLTTRIRAFAPHLKKLALTGSYATLGYTALALLLSSLTDCGGTKSILESLQVRVILLSPDHIGLFSSLLPNLKSLDLGYRSLTYDPSSSPWLSGVRKEGIYESFRARRYPQWHLKELRVVQVNGCPYGHPDTCLLESIAEGLPSLEKVFQTRMCECLE